MTNYKIYQMPFAKVYSLLIAKVEKKGRTRDELDQVTCWLTGYTGEQLQSFMQSDLEYGARFESQSKADQGQHLRHPCGRD